MKKVLVTLLTCCMLLATCSIPAFADEQTTLPSWTLGNGTVNGKYTNVLHDTDPFNMVQYFTGQNAVWTANGDTPGVYEDLTVSTANALRYNCHMKSTTADPNNWAQGYTGIAGSGTGNFYFFPRVALAIGVTFTAPASGTVTFKYHLAKLLDSDSDTTLYMGVGNPGTMPEGVWKDTDFSSYGAKKLASASTLETVQEYTVYVEKGDVVYFLFASFDDSNPSRAAFYFDTVSYTSFEDTTSSGSPGSNTPSGDNGDGSQTGDSENNNASDNGNSNASDNGNSNGDGTGSAGQHTNGGADKTNKPSKNEDTTNVTEATDTEAASETESETEEVKSGCGSTVAGMPVAVACAGVAMLVARKKKTNK